MSCTSCCPQLAIAAPHLNYKEFRTLKKEELPGVKLCSKTKTVAAFVGGQAKDSSDHRESKVLILF